MVLPAPPAARKVRKQLSADALYTLLGESFARIPEHRQPQPPIPLRDALLSAYISPATDTLVAWFCTSDGNNQEETMARAIVKSLK